MVKDSVRGRRAGILCVFCVVVKTSTAAAAAEKESARLVSQAWGASGVLKVE